MPVSAPTMPSLAPCLSYRAAGWRHHSVVRNGSNTAARPSTADANSSERIVIADLTMCDYAVDIGKTHVPTVREALSWSAIYPTNRPKLGHSLFGGCLSSTHGVHPYAVPAPRCSQRFLLPGGEIAPVDGQLRPRTRPRDCGR